ncbi:hypothetical protein [Yellowstone lake phycodnavirus 2]|uniref:hypothetical protein n=1 Tax=Yellowstone lake phycodnavirus 2 TaxID=1586714 RepID=UPI0006EB505B|nr:hypothetical protein AR678_gp151 [Yellowstone lake phycodnavirus 2]BAT22425.1 hypothetical protein [Yellowstone lake phycodnavirus 2]
MSNRGSYLSTTKEYRNLERQIALGSKPGAFRRLFGGAKAKVQNLANKMYARKKLAPINYKLSIGWKQHVMGLLRKQQNAQQKVENLKRSWTSVRVSRGNIPNFKSRLNTAERNLEEAKRRVKNARRQKVLTIGSTEYTKKGATPTVSAVPVVKLNNKRLVNIARKARENAAKAKQIARILANQNAKQKAKAAANAKAANANASRKRSIAMIRGAQNAGYRKAPVPNKFENTRNYLSNNNNGPKSHALVNNHLYNDAYPLPLNNSNSNNNFHNTLEQFPENVYARGTRRAANLLFNEAIKKREAAIAKISNANAARAVLERKLANKAAANALAANKAAAAVEAANKAATAAAKAENLKQKNAVAKRVNLLREVAAPLPKRANLLQEVAAPQLRSSGLLRVAGAPKQKSWRERTANLVRARKAQRNARHREASLRAIFPRHNFGGRAIV